MSFGYSIGDFIAGANLSYRLIKALSETQGSSIEYQEAISELSSLQHTFLEVSQMRGSKTLNEATINMVEVIVMSSMELIGAFLAKTQKYRERLCGRRPGSTVSDSWQKMGWVLFTKDELKRLRDQLHVKLSHISLLLSTAQFHGKMPPSIANYNFDRSSPSHQKEPFTPDYQSKSDFSENGSDSIARPTHSNCSPLATDGWNIPVVTTSSNTLVKKTELEGAMNISHVEESQASKELPHIGHSEPRGSSPSPRSSAYARGLPPERTAEFNNDKDYPMSSQNTLYTNERLPDIEHQEHLPRPRRQYHPPQQWPGTKESHTADREFETKLRGVEELMKAQTIDFGKSKQEVATRNAPEKAAKYKTEVDVEITAKARADYEYDTKTKVGKAEGEAKSAIEKAQKEVEEAAPVAATAQKDAEVLIDKALLKDEKKKPIKFKDALGRKFSFPFHLCATWAGMDELIQQAFLHVEVIRPLVRDGHYDLVSVNGEIILPQVWESMIEPDWSISMQMWLMPEKELPISAPLGHFVSYKPGSRHKNQGAQPGLSLPDHRSGAPPPWPTGSQPMPESFSPQMAFQSPHSSATGNRGDFETFTDHPLPLSSQLSTSKPKENSASVAKGWRELDMPPQGVLSWIQSVNMSKDAPRLRLLHLDTSHFEIPPQDLIYPKSASQVSQTASSTLVGSETDQLENETPGKNAQILTGTHEAAVVIELSGTEKFQRPQRHNHRRPTLATDSNTEADEVVDITLSP